MKIEIQINTENTLEATIIKDAIQRISNNFNKDNLKYIAELSKTKDVNAKFEKLKNNPLVKTIL